MREIAALILAALLSLPLAACGHRTEDSLDTPENMEQPSQTEIISMAEVIQDTMDDSARAEQRYCNKILMVEGDITEIGGDYLTIGSFDVVMRVPLADGDLENLTLGQRITVLGKTGNEIQSADGLQSGAKIYIMEAPRLVRDTVEWTGELKGLNGGNDGSYNMKIGDYSTLRRVYFADGVTVPDRDTEITVSGKCIDNDLRNAVIVDAAK